MQYINNILYRYIVHIHNIHCMLHGSLTLSYLLRHSSLKDFKFSDISRPFNRMATKCVNRSLLLPVSTMSSSCVLALLTLDSVLANISVTWRKRVQVKRYEVHCVSFHSTPTSSRVQVYLHVRMYSRISLHQT